MPTYTVTAPEGCLDDEKRSAIAREITRIHHEAAGAPSCFAQVIFIEVAPGRYFVGGMPLRGQVFVNGQIRAGRSKESMDALIPCRRATDIACCSAMSEQRFVYQDCSKRLTNGVMHQNRV